MGYLITLEGGEYTGKTSLAEGLRRVFAQAQIHVKLSREPGGTAQGEKLREEFFTKENQEASAAEILLLLNKDRELLVTQVILPFLGKHKEYHAVMILDRYLDTTRVLQGIEGGIDIQTLKEFDMQYAKGLYPDLTIILYFPKDQFAQTFTKRKSMKRSYASKTEQVNTFDQVDIEHQYKRQIEYLSLPDIAQELHEDRMFVKINSARKFSLTLHDTIHACGTCMPMYAKPLMQAYHALTQEGAWYQLDALWPLIA